MGLAVCAAPGCGALIDPGARGRRCPAHRAMVERQRGTTAARGYGADHRRRRRQLAAQLAAGQTLACARCGRPITAADSWHLDHADQDRGSYLGPSHAACNAAAGGRAAAQRG